MPQLSHLRAFLGELAEVAGSDAATLPLAVLVNVCRGRMRQPLLNVKLLAGVESDDPYLRSIEVEQVLDARYPAMAEADLIQQHPTLPRLAVSCLEALNQDRTELNAALDELHGIDAVAWQLVAYTTSIWSSTEVAVRLYAMTCGSHARDTLAPLLDAMLGLDPLVGQMLLDLARMRDTNG